MPVFRYISFQAKHVGHRILRPRRMHKVHKVARCVSLSVLSVTRLRCAKTTERIEVLFRVDIL